MYVIGTVIFWSMIFIFYWINNWPDSFSKFFNISFLTFSKGFFVIGMNLVLLPVLMGHFSIFRGFLAFDAFTPLARLTFGAYMVHPTFMLFDALNTVRGEYLTINFGIVRYLCWLVVSFACSLIVTLLVETPCMNLEKQFLMGGGKKKPQRKEEKGVNEKLFENPDRNSNGSPSKMIENAIVVGKEDTDDTDGKEVESKQKKGKKSQKVNKRKASKKKEKLKKVEKNGNYHISKNLNKTEKDEKMYSINAFEEDEDSFANVDMTSDSIPDQNRIRKFHNNAH